MIKLIFYVPYTTVSEIPLGEYKNLHRKYWELIAKNNLNYKPSIVSAINDRLLNVACSCFACEYTFINKQHYCPLYGLKCYHTDETTYCSKYRYNGLYALWIDADDVETRNKIALEIANMKWEDYHEHEN